MRNIQNLEANASKHSVVKVGDGLYDITSGGSGNTYHVVLTLGLAGESVRATCDCKWGTSHRHYDHSVMCSHSIAAVKAEIAEQGASAEFFSGVGNARAAAGKQPVVKFGDGISVVLY